MSENLQNMQPEVEAAEDRLRTNHRQLTKAVETCQAGIPSKTRSQHLGCRDDMGKDMTNTRLWKNMQDTEAETQNTVCFSIVCWFLMLSEAHGHTFILFLKF